MYCANCNNTGETGHYGILDCRADGCTAAVERAALNAYMATLDRGTQYDRDWAAYQFGKTKQAGANFDQLAAQFVGKEGA